MKGFEEMPLIRVDRIKDLKPPLSEDLGDFFQGIIDGARASFEKDHECYPFFFMLKNDELTPMIMDYGQSEELKIKAFQFMHSQIAKNDACIFVVEAWFAKALKSECDALKKGGGMLLRPSQRADRRESVMVHFWTSDRRITIWAEIERNPDKLGEWNLMEDTALKNMTHCEGRLIPDFPVGRSDHEDSSNT